MLIDKQVVSNVFSKLFDENFQMKIAGVKKTKVETEKRILNEWNLPTEFKFEHPTRFYWGWGHHENLNSQSL